MKMYLFNSKASGLKRRVVKQYDMKTYWGSGVTALRIFSLDIRRR